MVDVIEGRGQRVDSSAPKALLRGLSVPAYVAKSLYDFLSASNNQISDLKMIDEDILEDLFPFMRFNQDLDVVFRPVPRDHYLAMLQKVALQEYQAIVGSDLEEKIENPVDVMQFPLSTGFQDYEEIFNLRETMVGITARAVQNVTRNAFIIPDITFLSSFFSDPDALLEYAARTDQLQGGPLYVSHRVHGMTNAFVAQKLPSYSSVFSVENIATFRQGGATHVCGLLDEYRKVSKKLDTFSGFPEGKVKKLYEVLHELHPEYF